MSRVTKVFGVGLLLVVILSLSFGVGYAVGSRTQSAQGLDSVAEAWNILSQDYVDKTKLDSRIMPQGAIEGMVEALGDPYTAYLDVDAYKLGLSSLEGEIEGIGAQVAIREDKLTIIAPIPDSPAAKAGIKAGDQILEIDGKSASAMSLVEAVLRIRGREGTSVQLLILHEGETDPKLIEVVRAKIKLASVRFEMKGDIAYINITQFAEGTATELSSVIQSLPDEKATAIILDLRSNPGGFLSTVVDVTSQFLREGVVVYVVNNKGERSALNVKPGAATTELPVVVLVDGFTASGGEVLAGALQDYKRAVVAGTKTFGKGSVNILRQLKDGSGLYVTTARWLTPNGHLIEGEGLQPDHVLQADEDAIQWATNYLKAGKV